MKNWYNKLSLKYKLIALNVTVVALIGFGFIGALNFTFHKIEENYLHRGEATANSLADSVAAQFYERYGDVQAFALNPDMQTGNREKIVDALNAYVALYGIYDLVLVTDTKGKLVAVNSKDVGGNPIKSDNLYDADFSSAHWFKAAMDGKFTEQKEKNLTGTYVENFAFDQWVTKVYGEQKYGSGFTSTIKNAKGQVMGVITNRAGARWVATEFSEGWKNLKEMDLPGSELALLDADGTVMFEYDPTAAKTENFVFDPNVLGKLNLVTAGLPFAKEMQKGKTDAVWAKHTRKGMVQAAAFSPVESPKFVNSLGWKVLVRQSKEELFGALLTMEHAVLGGVILGIIFCAMVAYWFSTNLSRVLTGLVLKLDTGSNALKEFSGNLASSSTELSSAATEQASSLQQTSASISEISAMVGKSADNAQKSQENSKAGLATIRDGRSAITDMLTSMNEIDQSNRQIIQQVESNNKEFNDIVKLINDIGSKTKVINDIVFQTKLLSFNASVEAARAGEHGKGFAVVAEEVGNLAQMSGNAAKEISGMLEESTRRVSEMAQQSKTTIERLLADAKNTLQKGNKNADRCSQALESITKSAEEIGNMLSEIAESAKEQAIGVSEVTEAVNQMDKVTQQNSFVASKSAKESEELSQQALALKAIVQELNLVIEGQNKGGFVSEKQTIAKPVKSFTKSEEKVSAGTSNVIKLENVRPSKTTMDEGKIASSGLKKAVGSDNIPDANDPRFEEV